MKPILLSTQLCWLVLALSLSLGVQMHASAQTAPAAVAVAAPNSAIPASAAALHPANPLAAVPPTRYRSVFANTPRGVEADTTPWRAANEEVGKFLRGHVDILKWEEQETARQGAKEKSAKNGPEINKPSPTSAALPAITPPAAHKH